MKNLRKVASLPMEEKTLVQVAYELFNSIDFSQGSTYTKSLYNIFNLIDNILNYPFSDE